MANITRTIERTGQPFEPPCALFSSGEMIVTVAKETGIGGRNQEFTLSTELKKHNTSPALWKLKSGIIASPNMSLNDLTVALVMGYNKQKGDIS